MKKRFSSMFAVVALLLNLSVCMAATAPPITMHTNQTLPVGTAVQVDAASVPLITADPAYGDPTILLSDYSFGSYSVFSGRFTPSGKIGTVTITYKESAVGKPDLVGTVDVIIEGQVADSLMPHPGVPTP